MKYKIKFNYSQGQYDTCIVPYAFCEAAARILYLAIARKKYPNAVYFLVDSVESIKINDTIFDDMFNNFK